MIDWLRIQVTAADAGGFWFFWLALLAGCGFALWRGLGARWLLRMIADTPTARIRSAPQGYVKLFGEAKVNGELLTAPLTGLPCVWFSYRISERRGRSGKQHWVSIEHQEAQHPFVLDDRSGRCLVAAAGAEVHCRSEDRWTGQRRDQPRPTGLSGMLVDGRYAFVEQRILAGDYALVLGRLETPRFGQQQRRRHVRDLLVRWKRNPERLAQFDLNGDGEIGVDEWERARGEAERDAARVAEAEARQPPLSRIAKPKERRHPFLISTQDELDFGQKIHLQAYGGLAAFVVLATLAIFTLIVRLWGSQ